ncbi:LytTR family DNA-binding domain-containing protein [Fulvivirgaceae bacterium BMA10]|uniref:LytTR family DNA-binding domain-containing protein n=1 Tax=Splendidivirga corallicola TaxID=3051826 RepID=A0ABT8KZA5_9BACT|nr:LytTR family DNA-binding domain-containing protein [Fulvivirgaceae bacterium BMA10]
MQQQLSAIIVDDEAYARGIIRLMLESHDDITVLSECSNGIEAVETIKQTKPDLVFLDIQMPEVNGFDVIKEVQNYHKAYYIFTTAYDEYALKAFEVNAIDYLLKPFDDNRFEEALRRAKEQIKRKELEALSQKFINILGDIERKEDTTYLNKISIRSGGKIYFIDVANIDWIEADNQYVQIHVAGSKHILRESLTSLERSLNPQFFYRTHRSAIINIKRIKELEPHFKGDYVITLLDGTKVKLSRSRKDRLKGLLNW